MNPPITHTAMVRICSSPGVWDVDLFGIDCVCLFMVYMSFKLLQRISPSLWYVLVCPLYSTHRGGEEGGHAVYPQSIDTRRTLPRKATTQTLQPVCFFIWKVS